MQQQPGIVLQDGMYHVEAGDEKGDIEPAQRCGGAGYILLVETSAEQTGVINKDTDNSPTRHQQGKDRFQAQVLLTQGMLTLTVWPLASASIATRTALAAHAAATPAMYKPGNVVILGSQWEKCPMQYSCV